MKGPGHCLMQAVNYTGSNEIKLMMAIKSSIKPYRSQINGVSLNIKNVWMKWSSVSHASFNNLWSQSLEPQNHVTTVWAQWSIFNKALEHRIVNTVWPSDYLIKALTPQPLICYMGWAENTILLMYSSPPCWTLAPCSIRFDLESQSRSSDSQFLMGLSTGSLHLF